MKCPECKRSLPDVASACRCGWTKHGNPEQPLGYRQCEWMAGQEQCLHPGSLSPSTTVGGPWYCRLHFGCDDAIYGSQIVEASRGYKHPTRGEIEAEHTERARAYAAAQGLARHEGEAKAVWTRRILVWVRSKQRGIGRSFDDAEPQQDTA